MRPLAVFLLACAAALAVSGCTNGNGRGNGGGHEVPARRLLILSLDGLAWDLAKQKMAEGKLPALAALASRGAVATGGSLSCYPAKTAPAHATLWTGCWADRHQVLGNETPRLPRGSHTILEHRPGFDAEALLAEPLWRTAAREGRSVTVVQATHADPANEDELGLHSLQIFSGYHAPVGAALVTGPAFSADERTFLIEPGGDGVDISCSPVRVHLPPATWVAIDHPAVRGVFYVYLAKLDATGWAVLRSSYSAVAAPTAGEAERFRKEVGGYAYNAQKVEPSLLDGTAWKREAYLAATRLNALQVKKAVLWALREHPAEITMAYLPQPDAVLHELLGKAEVWADREARATIDEVLAICDGLAGDLVEAMGPGGSIALVSDHGMAPVDHVFYPNLVLERAGLLTRNGAGGIDLGHTQVLFSQSGDFIVVNTVDHRGGCVPISEREAWLALAEKEIVKAAEAALGSGALRPPVRPGSDAGGVAVSAQGDSWFSSACDGVLLYAVLSPDLPAKAAPVVRQIDPVGYHSGDPRIERLAAMMIFAGPGFRHAEAVGVRHVDFAPTVLQWLGVEPPAGTAGRALEQFLETK